MELLARLTYFELEDYLDAKNRPSVRFVSAGEYYEWENLIVRATVGPTFKKITVYLPSGRRLVFGLPRYFNPATDFEKPIERRHYYGRRYDRKRINVELIPNFLARGKKS